MAKSSSALPSEPTHSFHDAVQRRIFAKYHTDYFSEDDWRKVLWVARFRIDDDLKVWAFMTYEGVGTIKLCDMEDCDGSTEWDEFDTKLDLYSQVLAPEILNTLNEQKLRTDKIILQTLPVYHGNISYKATFSGYMSGWPDNSMDLHPMTSIFEKVKTALLAEKEDFTKLSPTKQKNRLEAAWKKIPATLVKESIDKTPDRLKNVLERNGQAISTPYRYYCIEDEEEDRKRAPHIL